jgi:hypothetical protein
MSLLEVKSQLRSFSAPERREITAFLFDLQDEEREAAELSRVHREMDDGRRVSLEDCIGRHAVMAAKGE